MSSLASVISLGIVLLLAGMNDAAAWWETEDTRGYATENGQIIKPVVLVIDMQKAKLRIVSVPFEAEAPRGATELSLQTFGETLAKNPKYRSKDWIAVNGGFSSYAADTPLGLLVSDGRVYSTLASAKSNNEFSSEFGQLRWGGVLCQTEQTGRWELLPATRYRPKMCSQAIQAGPVLVEPDFKVGVAPSEPQRKQAYRRTAVCLVDDSRIKIVLTEQDTNLLPFAKWLAQPQSAGGAGCRAAINLSGDTSSGVAIRSPKARTTQFIGEGSFPIPSALIFERRGSP